MSTDASQNPNGQKDGKEAAGDERSPGTRLGEAVREGIKDGAAAVADAAKKGADRAGEAATGLAEDVGEEGVFGAGNKHGESLGDSLLNKFRDFNWKGSLGSVLGAIGGVILAIIMGGGPIMAGIGGLIGFFIGTNFLQKHFSDTPEPDMQMAGGKDGQKQGQQQGQQQEQQQGQQGQQQGQQQGGGGKPATPPVGNNTVSEAELAAILLKGSGVTPAPMSPAGQKAPAQSDDLLRLAALLKDGLPGGGTVAGGQNTGIYERVPGEPVNLLPSDWDKKVAAAGRGHSMRTPGM